MSIKLGDKAKDTISGFSGIVTGVFSYLNGCVRICLSPDYLDKDGKLLEEKVFDEPQLELVTSATAPLALTAVGGPRSDPASRSTPSR